MTKTVISSNGRINGSAGPGGQARFAGPVNSGRESKDWMSHEQKVEQQANSETAQVTVPATESNRESTQVRSGTRTGAGTGTASPKWEH
ncbi:hypothetical protein N7539_002295 [Penicillium diatomitis]|uniref:Uncharacterized protein n=1 Tax=Penicillium diatomitis TaxID=2819901 RepID=A0A9W9XF09_9EURO|nr:uncharacterized protein N7539_002295 [Penicillium diatomitis]KAJ5490728.1 hypothetical protein N7539_002295 [Penicillium diatomitis]